jgi:hypothetical protein
MSRKAPCPINVSLFIPLYQKLGPFLNFAFEEFAIALETPSSLFLHLSACMYSSEEPILSRKEMEINCDIKKVDGTCTEIEKLVCNITTSHEMKRISCIQEVGHNYFPRDYNSARLITGPFPFSHTACLESDFA